MSGTNPLKQNLHTGIAASKITLEAFGKKTRSPLQRLLNLRRYADGCSVRTEFNNYISIITLMIIKYQSILACNDI